jgi:predicted anti-sigma-YlaC factor YlaD
MTCQQATEMFADLLLDSMHSAAKPELQTHLGNCASCREEVESLAALWTKLGALPKEQSSAAMRPRFYAMLEAYQQGLQHSPSDRASKVRVGSGGPELEFDAFNGDIRILKREQ